VQRQYPSLHFPVMVELRQLNRAATKWDDKAREPVGHVVRDPAVAILAQVQYNRIEEPIPDFLGVRHDSRGYLVFLWRDLNAAGLTVARGDKITKIGNRDVSYFVSYFEDCGHYEEFGATMLKAFFVDRDPGEQD
jgi:hypothetical protein